MSTVILLPPQANPASTSPYAVKTGTNTTAHTNPINKQGSCPTGLGHRAFDQLVAVNQVFPINDRMTDLNHGKRILANVEKVNPDLVVRDKELSMAFIKGNHTLNISG